MLKFFSPDIGGLVNSVCWGKIDKKRYIDRYCELDSDDKSFFNLLLTFWKKPFLTSFSVKNMNEMYKCDVKNPFEMIRFDTLKKFTQKLIKYVQNKQKIVEIIEELIFFIKKEHLVLFLEFLKEEQDKGFDLFDASEKLFSYAIQRDRSVLEYFLGIFDIKQKAYTCSFQFLLSSHQAPVFCEEDLLRIVLFLTFSGLDTNSVLYIYFMEYYSSHYHNFLYDFNKSQSQNVLRFYSFVIGNHMSFKERLEEILLNVMKTRSLTLDEINIFISFLDIHKLVPLLCNIIEQDELVTCLRSFADRCEEDKSLQTVFVASFTALFGTVNSIEKHTKDIVDLMPYVKKILKPQYVLIRILNDCKKQAMNIVDRIGKYDDISKGLFYIMLISSTVLKRHLIPLVDFYNLHPNELVYALYLFSCSRFITDISRFSKILKSLFKIIDFKPITPGYRFPAKFTKFIKKNNGCISEVSVLEKFLSKSFNKKYTYELTKEKAKKLIRASVSTDDKRSEQKLIPGNKSSTKMSNASTEVSQHEHGGGNSRGVNTPEFENGKSCKRSQVSTDESKCISKSTIDNISHHNDTLSAAKHEPLHMNNTQGSDSHDPSCTKPRSDECVAVLMSPKNNNLSVSTTENEETVDVKERTSKVSSDRSHEKSTDKEEVNSELWDDQTNSKSNQEQNEDTKCETSQWKSSISSLLGYFSFGTSKKEENKEPVETQVDVGDGHKEFDIYATNKRSNETNTKTSYTKERHDTNSRDVPYVKDTTTLTTPVNTLENESITPKVVQETPKHSRVDVNEDFITTPKCRDGENSTPSPCNYTQTTFPGSPHGTLHSSYNESNSHIEDNGITTPKSPDLSNEQSENPTAFQRFISNLLRFDDELSSVSFSVEEDLDSSSLEVDDFEDID